jgi:hypothetical protein
MVQPETWRLIANDVVKVWNAVGTLIVGVTGILLGAYLTARRQNRDWLLNNKRDEYRELLDVITKTSSVYTQMFWLQTSQSADDQRLVMASDARYVEIVRSRLFIRKTAKELEIAKRLTQLTTALKKDRQVSRFSMGIDQLIKDIQDTAEKDLIQ